MPNGSQVNNMRAYTGHAGLVSELQMFRNRCRYRFIIDNRRFYLAIWLSTTNLFHLAEIEFQHETIIINVSVYCLRADIKVDLMKWKQQRLSWREVNS